MESGIQTNLAAQEDGKIDPREQLRKQAEDALSLARVSADPHCLVAPKVIRAEQLIRDGHYERALHLLRSGMGG